MKDLLAKLNRRRNVIFHALYGVPAALALLLDQIKSVDTTPLLSQLVPAERVPAVITGIAVASIVLHFLDPMHQQGGQQ